MNKYSYRWSIYHFKRSFRQLFHILAAEDRTYWPAIHGPLKGWEGGVGGGQGAMLPGPPPTILIPADTFL
jgi:hypothetical protein